MGTAWETKRNEPLRALLPYSYSHTALAGRHTSSSYRQREEEDERDACKDKQLEGMCWACGPRLRCPLACYFCGLLVRLFVLLWL
jgi:hypothetical protein